MEVRGLRIGVAIDEKWFCMSMTSRAVVLGLGFRCLVMYFL